MTLGMPLGLQRLQRPPKPPGDPPVRESAAERGVNVRLPDSAGIRQQTQPNPK